MNTSIIALIAAVIGGLFTIIAAIVGELFARKRNVGHDPLSPLAEQVVLVSSQEPHKYHNLSSREGLFLDESVIKIMC